MHSERGLTSLYGGQGQNPLKLMTCFESETLFFDVPVIVVNKITILMIHMLRFNAAQRAFKNTHFVY